MQPACSVSVAEDAEPVQEVRSAYVGLPRDRNAAVASVGAETYHDVVARAGGVGRGLREFVGEGAEQGVRILGLQRRGDLVDRPKHGRHLAAALLSIHSKLLVGLAVGTIVIDGDADKPGLW